MTLGDDFHPLSPLKGSFDPYTGTLVVIYPSGFEYHGHWDSRSKIWSGRARKANGEWEATFRHSLGLAGEETKVPTIPVQIQTMMGEIWKYDFEDSTTIGMIKERICSEQGVPPAQQGLRRLNEHGALRDSVTLQQLGGAAFFLGGAKLLHFIKAMPYNPG
jgi:hypothetical protein